MDWKNYYQDSNTRFNDFMTKFNSITNTDVTGGASGTAAPQGNNYANRVWDISGGSNYINPAYQQQFAGLLNETSPAYQMAHLTGSVGTGATINPTTGLPGTTPLSRVGFQTAPPVTGNEYLEFIKAWLGNNLGITDPTTASADRAILPYGSTNPTAYRNNLVQEFMNQIAQANDPTNTTKNLIKSDNTVKGAINTLANDTGFGKQVMEYILRTLYPYDPYNNTADIARQEYSDVNAEPSIAGKWLDFMNRQGWRRS